MDEKEPYSSESSSDDDDTDTETEMPKKKIVKKIVKRKKKPTILGSLIGKKSKDLVDELTREKKQDPEVKATHNDAYGTAEAVRKAIDKIYYENKVLKPPKILQVDAGSEFKKGLDGYLKEKGIYLRRAGIARHSQQANVEARNKSIGSIIIKTQLVKELENDKVSKQWLKLLPDILKKLNENAKVKKLKQTGKVPCKEGGDCDLYEVGRKVRYKLDYPVNFKGEKQIGNFREGDIRYSLKPHKIENILLLPDRPVRYILEGVLDKTFSKNQLKPAENEIVKKAIEKKTPKPREKWTDKPVEIRTSKRKRKQVDRGFFVS
eukprot:jgi/Bigna1/144258/aug1.85_g18966